MRILAALAIFFAVSPTALFATVQVPDLLWIGGTAAEMLSDPMERYFEKFPAKRPETTIISSNLWRGYAAHYEVRGGKLYVKELKIRADRKILFFVPVEWENVTKEVFPRRADRFLSWYTGFIILAPTVVQYPSDPSPRLLFFKDGRLQADRAFSSTEFNEYSRMVFSVLDKSDEYKARRAREREKYTGVPGSEAWYFIYNFDQTFPFDALVNYKDFQPNKASDRPAK